MAAVGHFGCPKFTLDHNSGHFRSIQIFYLFFTFFTKWLPSAILHVRTRWITFLAILDQYRSFIFFEIFTNGWRRPFWMSEIHFLSYFWPFQIDRPFLDFPNSLSIVILAISDRCRFFFTGGHFGCLKITLDRISGHFRLIGHFGMSEIHFRWHFWPFFDKMAAGAILDVTTMSIIELVRDIWMNNACVKIEERGLNPSKVIALTTKMWRSGGGGGPRGGCVADENIIFPKTYVSREYNYRSR